MNQTPPLSAQSPLNAEDQAWIESLAGQPMSTAPAHQAQQLRHYFAQRDELEVQHVPSAESQARMLNKLKRAGVLKTQKASASSKSGLAERLTEFLDWLIPVGSGAAPRYALIAGVALAVMVVPVLMRTHSPTQDSGLRSGPRTAPLGTNVQTILAHSPVQTAQEMQDALQTVGVVADILPQADGVRLMFEVQPEKQMLIQQSLNRWGITAPTGMTLDLRVVAIGRS